MILSDSHCHLDGYEAELLIETLDQAKANHVEIIVGVGMDLRSSAETIRLAQSFDEVLAAIGVHPWYAVPPTEEVRTWISELAREQRVVALGEIGLDYVRGPDTKEIQKELLRYELSVALELGLPVNLHCREAHQDMMEIMRREAGSGLKGIAHGFSGDLAALNDWLELGFYISIGRRGLIIDRIPSLEAIVGQIPLDRLITETDASPRGEAIGPAGVVPVVEKLASLRGVPVAEIGNAATANLKRLFAMD